jgi:hypothetical protein
MSNAENWLILAGQLTIIWAKGEVLGIWYWRIKFPDTVLSSGI